MDYFNWWPGSTTGMIIETMLVLLGTSCLAVWCLKKLRKLRSIETQGRLLLQMEINGMLLAHISMLTAEERNGNPRYVWRMSQINGDDFPYTQMTDLSFTHIIVTQKRAERSLVTISVLDHTANILNADFYWIKDATIGNRPGFPRELLLPHNLVLKYFDYPNGDQSS